MVQVKAQVVNDRIPHGVFCISEREPLSTKCACAEGSDLLVTERYSLRVIAADATVVSASLARFGDAPARPAGLEASPAPLVRLGASPAGLCPVANGRHTTGSEM